MEQLLGPFKLSGLTGGLKRRTFKHCAETGDLGSRENSFCSPMSLGIYMSLGATVGFHFSILSCEAKTAWRAICTQSGT